VILLTRKCTNGDSTSEVTMLPHSCTFVDLEEVRPNYNWHIYLTSSLGQEQEVYEISFYSIVIILKFIMMSFEWMGLHFVSTSIKFMVGIEKWSVKVWIKVFIVFCSIVVMVVIPTQRSGPFRAFTSQTCRPDWRLNEKILDFVYRTEPQGLICELVEERDHWHNGWITRVGHCNCVFLSYRLSNLLHTCTCKQDSA
jgi:hypothetical protein